MVNALTSFSILFFIWQNRVIRPVFSFKDKKIRSTQSYISCQVNNDRHIAWSLLLGIILGWRGSWQHDEVIWREKSVTRWPGETSLEEAFAHCGSEAWLTWWSSVCLENDRAWTGVGCLGYLWGARELYTSVGLCIQIYPSTMVQSLPPSKPAPRAQTLCTFMYKALCRQTFECLLVISVSFLVKNS